jgi:hypothetical protein
MEPSERTLLDALVGVKVGCLAGVCRDFKAGICGTRHRSCQRRSPERPVPLL